MWYCAGIILGEQTAFNPTVLFQEDLPYGQQVGENLINASLASGMHITSLFVAYGFPDEPQVMKKAVGLNPIVIIVVMLIGAKLAGILGLILSVPLSAALAEFIGDLRKKDA